MDAAEPTLETAPERTVERLMEHLGLSKNELADALDATPGGAGAVTLRRYLLAVRPLRKL